MSKVKTFSNETTERYALALFELANENSELEKIEKNTTQLLNVCLNNQSFNNFLKNPTHQLEIQNEVFEKIAKIMKFEPIFKNFLKLVVSKRRVYFLDKILEKFTKLSSKKKGKIDAVLTSSKNLTQDQLDHINAEISKTVKSKVDFIFKKDENLISGIKIQLGSLLIDTSVRNKLKRIKNLMIDN